MALNWAAKVISKSEVDTNQIFEIVYQIIDKDANNAVLFDNLKVRGSSAADILNQVKAKATELKAVLIESAKISINQEIIV